MPKAAKRFAVWAGGAKVAKRCCVSPGRPIAASRYPTPRRKLGSSRQPGRHTTSRIPLPLALPNPLRAYPKLTSTQRMRFLRRTRIRSRLDPYTFSSSSNYVAKLIIKLRWSVSKKLFIIHPRNRQLDVAYLEMPQDDHETTRYQLRELPR